MTLTNTELERLSELEQAATAGVWNCMGQHLYALRPPDGPHQSLLGASGKVPCWITWFDDALFIVHIRNAARDLIRDLREARALLAEMLQTFSERGGECAGSPECRDGVHDWDCIAEFIDTYRPKVRALLVAAGVEVT